MKRIQLQNNLFLNIENIVDKEQDDRIIAAIVQTVEFSNDTINTLWDCLSKCKFRNHIVGRGGSHIWIKNKSNLNLRMAIIN